MPIEIIFIPAASDNPLELARRRLLRAIAAMSVPRPIGPFPTAGDFEATSDFMRKGAEPMDAFFADVGHVVRDNASRPLDMTQFDEVVTNAITGNALYVCEQAAQFVRDDLLELAS